MRNVILTIVLLMSVSQIDGQQQMGRKSKPLESVYEISFKIYKRAIDFAYTANLTEDQREDLDNILAEQPNLVRDTLAQVTGAVPGQIQQNFNGNIGFVYIRGPLNDSQSDSLERALIQHHLHFAKQIILLIGEWHFAFVNCINNKMHLLPRIDSK